MARANQKAHSADIEIALRVLNAYTMYNMPITADEAYLRALTGDHTTPSDELACQVVQAELKRVRSTYIMTAGG